MTQDGARVRVQQAQEQRGERALALAAGADERDELPGLDAQVQPVEHRLAATGVGDAHVLQLDRAGAHVRGRERVGRGAHGRRGVERGEQAPGGLETVGAGVEVLTDHPDREVQLRGEQQHRQPDGERDVPVDELDRDGRGDERRPEHREQLEDERGEEGDPQRRHRLAPVGVAGLGQRPDLGGVAVVGAQRLQPADDVEEVRAEERERLPALLRGALRGEPDEDHEHRDQRDRDEQDQAGGEVAREDVHEDHDRHEHREDDLRQIAREVRLERVDALHGGRHEVAGALLAQPARARAQDVQGQALAQLGHDPARPEAPGRLEPRGAHGARRDDARQRDERSLDVGEALAAGEGARDDAAEQDRLCDDEPGREDAEDDRDDERDAGRARLAQEAPVDACAALAGADGHGQPAGDCASPGPAGALPRIRSIGFFVSRSKSSAETRLRNTQ